MHPHIRLNFLNIFFISFLIYLCSFLGLFYLGINKSLFQSEDLIPTSAVPFTILKEGNLNLNEYYDLFVKHYPNPDTKGDTPYYLQKINNNYYSSFPLLTSFIVIPLYVIPVMLNTPVTIVSLGLFSRIGGAFIASLSVSFFYLLLLQVRKSKYFFLKKYVISPVQVLLLLLIYAFCTNQLSLNSQGLWQHGSSTLFLTAGLFYLLKKNYGVSGFSFGLATIARPTNLLSLVFIGLFIFVRKFKKGKILFKSIPLNYFFCALVPLLLDSFLNIYLFKNLLNTGYGSQIGDWTGNIVEGFFGVWVSPSKGVLIYSPVLVFMFYGIFLAFKKYKKISLELFLSIIIILHPLFMAKWHHWYGGYSWGYRMTSDIIPYMVLMLIPFIRSKYFKTKSIKIIFLLFAVLSFIFQYMGLVFFDGTWHILYDKGEKNTSWLWSTKNSQIVFSIKRLLYKIGISNINPYPKLTE